MKPLPIYVFVENLVRADGPPSAHTLGPGGDFARYSQPPYFPVTTATIFFQLPGMWKIMETLRKLCDVAITAVGCSAAVRQRCAPKRRQWPGIRSRLPELQGNITTPPGGCSLATRVAYREESVKGLSPFFANPPSRERGDPNFRPGMRRPSSAEGALSCRQC